MLFNSFEFLLVFLPITLLLFYLVGSTSRSLAIRWLIVASLLFYGAWRPVNVLIIAPSIAINFVLASGPATIDERERSEPHVQGGARCGHPVQRRVSRYF